MSPYQKMYSITFNAISDALEQLDKLDVGAARKLLEDAQSRAEELYISQEEDGES